MNNARHVGMSGTGCAGQIAAVAASADGAQVLWFDKADQSRGVAAWRDGMAWFPNNHRQVCLRVDRSREKTLTYLISLSHGMMRQPLVEAFLGHEQEMVPFLGDNTLCQRRPTREFAAHHAELMGDMRQAMSWHRHWA